ncbi:MAG TPA: hypothetical protein VH475_04820 [Tepidisphaeraceae bacterium]|jgi:hypothetical protein
MNAMRWSVSLVLGGAMVFALGCDRKPSEPKVDNKPANPVVQDMKAAAEKAAEATKKAAEKAVEATKTAGADVAKAASDAAKTAKGVPAPTADAVKSDAAKAADAAKTKAADAAADMKTQGQQLLDKLDTAVKQNKLDQAQTYVDAIEKIKANLPDEVKAKYEQVKTSFQAAKERVLENTNK